MNPQEALKLITESTPDASAAASSDPAPSPAPPESTSDPLATSAEIPVQAFIEPSKGELDEEEESKATPEVEGSEESKVGLEGVTEGEESHDRLLGDGN